MPKKAFNSIIKLLERLLADMSTQRVLTMILRRVNDGDYKIKR